MKRHLFVVFGFLLTGCASSLKKIDPNVTNSSPGFEYRFPKTGEWLLGGTSPGNVVVGQKTEEKGRSVLATVKYGMIGVSAAAIEEAKKAGKKTLTLPSVREILADFRKNLENDAKQGRVKNIQTKYIEKKFEKGSCLLFSQTGLDNGILPMTNDGKWCVNEKTYSYIMLNISARVAEGKELPNIELEKNEFFDSLVFSDR